MERIWSIMVWSPTKAAISGHHVSALEHQMQYQEEREGAPLDLQPITIWGALSGHGRFVVQWSHAMDCVGFQVFDLYYTSNSQ